MTNYLIKISAGRTVDLSLATYGNIRFRIYYDPIFHTNLCLINRKLFRNTVTIYSLFYNNIAIDFIPKVTELYLE